MKLQTHNRLWPDMLEILKVLAMEKANSTEFDENTPKPVVIFMPEGSKTHMGSTVRLGSRKTLFRSPDCMTAKLYKNSQYVDERHRHRYEVNPEMVDALEKAGLKFVGTDESGKRMEFHPEFKSRQALSSILGEIRCTLQEGSSEWNAIATSLFRLSKKGKRGNFGSLLLLTKMHTTTSCLMLVGLSMVVSGESRKHYIYVLY